MGADTSSLYRLGAIFIKYTEFICSVSTAAKNRNFIDFFGDFVQIRHRPRFLCLLEALNYRDAPNQLHAIFMHSTSAELKYMKKICSLDAVLTLAIQQSINLEFTPILTQLRDGLRWPLI